MLNAIQVIQSIIISSTCNVLHNLLRKIMYIYHALINALSAQMIHVNLNMIFYPHVEHGPTEKYTKKRERKKHYKHTHTMTVAETGY